MRQLRKSIFLNTAVVSTIFAIGSVAFGQTVAESIRNIANRKTITIPDLLAKASDLLEAGDAEGAISLIENTDVEEIAKSQLATGRPFFLSVDHGFPPDFPELPKAFSDRLTRTKDYLVVGPRKFNKECEKVRDVARRLNGDCLESGPWRYPGLILEEQGRRIRVTLDTQWWQGWRDPKSNHALNSHPGKVSSSAVYSGKCKFVELSTDGLDPHFKFSITPNSFASRASAWWKGNLCQTGRESVDSRFSVASNRHQESVGFLMSPGVVQSMLDLATFDPFDGKYLDAEAKKSAVEEELESKAPEQKLIRAVRKSRVGPVAAAKKLNSDSVATHINRKRFNFHVEGGKAVFQILIHMDELGHLTEIVQDAISMQHEFIANLEALDRAVVKKPAKLV